MINIDYQPVKRKTYTLFGNSATAVDYYALIGSLADQILRGNNPEEITA
jgi:hypothetical protein